MTDSGDNVNDGQRWTGPDDELTSQIIGAAVEVHRTLGAGFVEGIYRNALVIELERLGRHVEMEKEVDVFFKGSRVGRQRVDLPVEEQVVVELKAVDSLVGIHYAQLRSYLRAMNLRTG